MENQLTDEVLQRVGEVLSRFKEIEVGYVFGSSLKGEFEDVDVALLLSKSFPPYESMKFAMRVGRELERALKHSFEFDVKILNLSPAYFQHEVINGRVVFCRDEAKRVGYEAEVLSNYLDYRDTLEWFNKELLARA
jgi:hypothetical protein